MTLIPEKAFSGSQVHKKIREGPFTNDPSQIGVGNRNS
jgi:hypothetical protein